MKPKKRLLSLLLCVTMLFSLCPQSVSAEGSMGTACTHEHTDDCYMEVIECVHEHDENCYSEIEGSVSENDATPSNATRREPKNCTHICTEESGCVVRTLNCLHEHDEDCTSSPETAAPAEGTEGDSTIQTATDSNGYYEIGTPKDDVAAVQALIDALPTLDTVTADDYDAVQVAYDAYNALSEEQQATIIGAEVFEKLLAWFNGQTMSVKSMPEITYITADGTDSTMGYATLDSTSSGTQSEGIYYVPSGFTLSSDLSFTGNTTLVLGDGVTLTVDGVLSCTGNLTITTVTGATNATLTVNGGVKSDDSNGYGIYTGSSLSIYAGTVNATGGNVTADSTDSYGIYVSYGSLTISGSSTSVTATGGTASSASYGICRAGGSDSDSIRITGGTVEATGGTASSRSCGIQNIIAFSIDGSAQVTAKGGNAQINRGIYTTGTMTVSGNARLTAEGDKINKTEDSCGIMCGTMTVSDSAEVTGEGGNVTNVSKGIECTTVTINGNAKVTAVAGTSDGNYSVGIDALEGAVNISGGTVKATGGAAKNKSYGIWAGSMSISDAKMTAYSESLTEESTNAKSSGICVMQGNGDSIAKNIISIDQTEGKKTMIYGKDNGPVSLSAYTLKYENGTFKLATDSTFTYSLAGQGDFASLLPIGYAFAYKYSMVENKMTPEPVSVTPGPIFLKLCDHTDNNGSSARENGTCKFCGANCNGKHDYVTSWGGCSSGCIDDTVCKHESIDASGKCAACQTQFRAKLTAGNDTFWAMNVSALMEKRAENAANTVTLYSDLKSMPAFTTTGTAWTLNLNGHLYDGQIYVGDSTTAGSLTVSNSGTGSWKSSIYGIRLVKGTAKLNVGVYLSLAEVPADSTLGVLLSAGAAFEKHVSSGDTYALFDTTGVHLSTDNTLRVVAHTSHTYDSTTGKCGCGATCTHTTIGDNGKCTTCQHQMAIKRVTLVGETYKTAWFDTVAEATKGLAANTDTQLCLYADVSADHLTDGGLKLLIDLNGHTLTANVTVGSNGDFQLKSQRSGGRLVGTVTQTGSRITLYGDTTVTGLVTLNGIANMMEGVTFEGGIKTTDEDKTLMDYLNGEAFAGSDNNIVSGKVTELTGTVKTVAHETHSYDSTTGKCACGAVAAVCVTGGSVTTGYESFADAYTAAQNGDTIKLFSNVTEAINIGKGITLDINGKTVSDLTVSVPATITDSTGGGTITTLTTGGSVKIGGLLAKGYGFRTSGEIATWYDGNSEATSVSDVSVQKLPIKSVSISANGNKTSFAYGEDVTLTANVTLASGVTATPTYAWVDADGSEQTLGSTQEITLNDLTPNSDDNKYTIRCTVTVDGYSLSNYIEFTVTKATLTDKYTAPTAKTGLTYMKGSVQELINAGSFGNNVTITASGFPKFWYGWKNYDNTFSWTTSAVTARNAGTYTVYWYIEGGDNYKDVGSAEQPYELTVTIDPRTVTPTVTVAGGSTYDGTEKKPSVTVKLDGATLTENTDYTVSYEDNVNAGENTAKVIVTAKQGSNYTFETVTKTFSIAKGDYNGTTTANGSAKYGGSNSVDLSGLIMPGGTATASIKTDTDKVLNGTPTMDGNKLQFTLANDAALVGKTADIEVSVSGCTNYENYKITVTLTVDDKLTPTVTAPTAIENLTYNGSDQTLINAASTTGGTLQYSLNNSTWSAALPKAKDADDYTVYYKVVGNADYADTAVNSIPVTIGKKAVTVKPQSYTITKGNAIPAFALEYDGLASGDSLTTSAAPTFTCYEADGNTAVSTSTAAGSYTITWTNSDAFNFDGETNYTVTTATTGTLTINAKPNSNNGNGGGNSDSENDHVTYYTLTFETNGGSSIKAVSTAYGKTIDLSGYAPTRSGYDFSGWYSDKGLTNKVTKIKLTGNKTVYAGWVKHNPNTGTSNPFTDVSQNDWFYEHVMFVYGNNLMIGTSATTFEPNSSTTRAQIAVIFYRMEGSPAVEGKNNYTDVEYGPGTAWYYNAATWAQQSGIMGGYGDGKFGPNDPVTREQLAAIFYRYAQYKGYDTTQGGMAIREFDDYENISPYAMDAMTWAVNIGIMNGKGNNRLDPQGTATRAEIAAMLHRFIEKYSLTPAPVAPTTGSGGNSGGTSGWVQRTGTPKMGDSTNMGLWLFTLCASAGAMTVLLFLKRREEEEHMITA